MSKILITGATSFVGQHLVKELLEAGCELCSLERLPARLFLKWVESVYHDLRAEVPERIISRLQDVTHVAHLTAEVSAVRSINDPVGFVETNVVGTYHALELARKLPNLKKFVYVSTGEVLGQVSSPFKLDEREPLRPANPYAASKAAGEALVNAYHVSFGLPTVIVRPMNLFGRGQVRGFIPDTVKRLHEHHTVKCHVDAKGEMSSRNWLHVSRFVALLRWLMLDERSEGIYHVVGPERDTLDVVETLAKAVGKAPFIENVPLPAGIDHRIVLEDTRIKNELITNSALDQELAETALSYA